MRLKCLTCEALARPAYYFAAQSPHQIDVELVRIGLHDTPPKLRDLLQQNIDRTQSCEAILLAYGLCGQSTMGLVARQIPLVIPRAHDCITLFLGSRKRYDEQFSQQPGTYWYSQDYIERRDGTSSLSLGLGSEGELVKLYDRYLEKYGKKKADLLMQVMEGWQSHYSRAVYIDVGLGGGKDVAEIARSEADQHGWNFEQMQGDLSLVRRLLFGEWAEQDFLVVQPGQVIRMSFDERVILAEDLP